MVRSVVRDGGNRGGGRSITALYVLCCSVGWTAFDVGDTCRECGEIGPEFGEVGVGEMSKTTAVIHELTAVFDQFTGCDLIHLFHLCVQACRSLSDEVGSGRNAFVQIAEDSILRHDVLLGVI